MPSARRFRLDGAAVGSVEVLWLRHGVPLGDAVAWSEPPAAGRRLAEAAGHGGRGRRHADQRDATGDHANGAGSAQGGLAIRDIRRGSRIDHDARARRTVASR